MTPIGPAAWLSGDLSRDRSWVHALTDAEIEELRGAIAAAGARPISQLGRADFALPLLDRALDRHHEDVLRGRGCALIRGLPVASMTRREQALAFWAIGARFGRAVPQNAAGHLLGHVKDLGQDPADPKTRIYTTNARQIFHTDSCDVVGLLCLATALEGGLSSIVSSVRIALDLKSEEPDLYAELTRPFPYDRKGEVPAGKAGFYLMPIVHEHEGLVSVFYARDFIEAGQRHPEAPRLSPAQIRALDAFDARARDPRYHLSMELEPGDIQLLHNHQILHARTAYRDHPEPERRRHLLRLWLSPEDGRPLPPVFAERYGVLEPGARGGIRVPGAPVLVPLEAE